LGSFWGWFRLVLSDLVIEDGYNTYIRGYRDLAILVLTDLVIVIWGSRVLILIDLAI
jgi:hypothetical protein